MMISSSKEKEENNMNHLTGLAHIALYTKNMDASVRFYEALGGVVTDRAESKKPTGTNLLTMVKMPGNLYLEIIEPHDGSPVTPDGGLFPHIALETDEIDEAVTELKAMGITSFRTPEPMTMPIFGGIRNIFFYGPDGELIELLQHL